MAVQHCVFRPCRIHVDAFRIAAFGRGSLHAPFNRSISVDALGLDSELKEQGIMGYKHAIITFLLRDVVDLSLEGYSAQNVISEITFESKEDHLRMQIWDCTGTSGWIEAKAIEVDLM